MKTQLLPHQVRGVQAATPFGGFALFMEQRTGKTLTALAVVEAKQARRLLIVCPSIAIPVWEKAIKQERLAVESFQVMTYQYAAIHAAEIIEELRPDMVIADECHRVKRRTSEQSKALRFICRQAKYKLALTGTPMDKYQDVWAQFDMIDPTVFGTWNEFRDRFLDVELVQLRPHLVEMPDGSRKWIKRKPFMKILGLKEHRRFEFNQKFHSIAYRVQLSDVETSSTAIRHIRVRFPLSESKETYKSMEDRMVATVNDARVSTPIVISQATKLQQITGGFLVDSVKEGVHRVGREKAFALKETIQKLGRGTRFVVVCRYIHEMDEVSRLLTKWKIDSIQIKGGTSEIKFESTAAVIQVQSGVAIDLKAASNMIFYSMDFSSLNFEQMLFRIRSMNGGTARYYYLLAEGSIDEHIFKSVRMKQSLAKLVCNAYRRNKDGREKAYQGRRG